MELQKKHVNIEFFDETSIENLITCLHYKMDKTIFIGYKKNMTENRKRIAEDFLKKRCQVEEIEFKTVNEYNPKEILAVLEAVLKDEKEQFCYFDLTGGEDLILTAMGMLAERYQVPVHKYDVERDKLIVFKRENQPDITNTGRKQEIVLNLDDIIGMQGGCINYKDQKAYKNNLDNEIFKKDIAGMWEVARKDSAKWNTFSAFLKAVKKEKIKANSYVVLTTDWEHAVKDKKEVLSENEIENYFNTLQKIKIMTWDKKEEKGIEFSYKNKTMKDCITDAGCLLELATYYNRKNSGEYSDVRVGIHLDWDGKVTYKGNDVENEIDVMTLKGNVPTFISCKNGEVDPKALYEIDTITEQLGGKYAKKELVIGTEMIPVYRKRAQEMKIEVTNGSEQEL